MIEIIKHKISPDCDLSVLSLEMAFIQFREKFEFRPKQFTLEVGIEDIFTVFELMSKVSFPLTKWNGGCARDFPIDYWQISAFKDNAYDKKYIVYSEGA